MGVGSYASRRWLFFCHTDSMSGTLPYNLSIHGHFVPCKCCWYPTPSVRYNSWMLSRDYTIRFLWIATASPRNDELAVTARNDELADSPWNDELAVMPRNDELADSPWNKGKEKFLFSACKIIKKLKNWRPKNHFSNKNLKFWACKIADNYKLQAWIQRYHPSESV